MSQTCCHCTCTVGIIAESPCLCILAIPLLCPTNADLTRWCQHTFGDSRVLCSARTVALTLRRAHGLLPTLPRVLCVGASSAQNTESVSAEAQLTSVLLWMWQLHPHERKNHLLPWCCCRTSIGMVQHCCFAPLALACNGQSQIVLATSISKLLPLLFISQCLFLLC